ncbi:MAG: FlgD immunoglobulin-like domain containing protein [bacterium]
MSTLRFSRFALFLAGLVATAIFLFHVKPTPELNSIAQAKVGVRTFTHEQLTDKMFLQEKFGIVKQKQKMMTAPGLDHPDQFLQYYQDITQGGPQVNAPPYPPNHRQLELQRARQRKHGVKKDRLGNAPVQFDWVQRGPGNVGGRTRALVVDLDADPGGDTWFAGSASGGIWKTTDAGQSWTNLTPDLAFLSTQVLVQSASAPEVLYAGTGEGWMPGLTAIDGNGIYKATDRGQSWTQLPATVNESSGNLFRNVSRMIIHPQSPDTVVATTNAGIFKTVDGGTSWQQVLDTNGAPATQVLYDGKDFSRQYAAVTAVGIYGSTDSGETWDLMFAPPVGRFPSGRIEIAIAPTNSSRLAASVETRTGNQNDIYLSNDGGAAWTRVDEASGGFVWMAGQGWYNNTLAFHPFSADTLFFAGVEIFRAVFLPETRTFSEFSSSTSNTASFLTFFNFGGDLLGGGGSSDVAPLFDVPSTVQPEHYRNVEIRFGPGQSQKAHRFFSIISGDGYQDYIDIPFSVWDTGIQQQLMVSFFDFDANGVFDLTDPQGNDNQYVLISNVPYNPDGPDAEIVAQGPLHNIIYFIWPVTPAGVTWDPGSHPQSTINIEVMLQEVGLRKSEQISSFSLRNPQPNNTHVDHHNLTMVPFDSATNRYRLLDGNDGGVFFSDDGGKTFSSTLNTYVTTQFYGVDKRPGVDEYVGGMQDNGTWQSPVGESATSASPYTFQLGGDGFDAVWNGANDEEWIGGAQGNWFWLVTNASAGHNATFTPIFPQFVGGANGPFISILASTKSNPELVLTVAPEGVYRSDDFGRTWTLTRIAEPVWGFNGSRTEIVQSLANPQIVWAGSRFNHVTRRSGRLHVSTDGGLTFRPVQNQYTEAGRLFSISGLETHPFEDSTAYVLHSRPAFPKIIRTTDLGQTWEDISGFGANATSDRGFPDVAVYSLLVLPHAPNTLWAGTEIGIFESTDNGASWAFADNGLPAVAVWQMKVVEDQIVVATHGRGIWSVTVPELPPPPIVTLPPRLKQIGGGGGGQLHIRAEFRADYDSSFIVVDGANTLAFGANEAPFDTSLTLVIPVSEPVLAVVALSSYKNGVAFKTAPRAVELFPLSEARAFYATNFSNAGADFLFDGLEITTPPAFADAALHSPHPYPDAPIGATIDFLATLAFPVIVSSENSTLMFDEIVIVEPGRTGVPWPEFGFWDFVVVEGSKDRGATWTALEPGYDARKDAVWETAFDTGSDGAPSMFRNHSVNLLETFQPDDEVLLRFRLNIDEGTNGWGWAIDNLAIQTEPVSVQAGPQLPTVFTLSQNYPNPFNPTTRIHYTLPRDSQVVLRIFNVVGQKVRDLVVNNRQAAGAYTAVWDGKDDFGRAVASGLYIYHIEAGDFVQSRKMTLIR